MIDRRIGKIKIRRGTEVQRKQIIFESGELVYSTDKKRVYIGDGVTYGGISVSNRNFVVSSLGSPISPPFVGEYGDIVFEKDTDRTYIIGYDTNNATLKLFLVSDAGLNTSSCCAVLQANLDALNLKLKTVKDYIDSKNTPTIYTFNWVTQPTDVSINVGQTATFNVSAFGTGTITYEWFRQDGLTINTTNRYNNVLQITNASILDIVPYYCVAKSTIMPSITSNTALLTVDGNSIISDIDLFYILAEDGTFIDWDINNIVAPTIITQPRTQGTTSLVSATFEVVATGTAPLSYQWRLNGVDISGETKSTYTISSPTKDVVGISCKVSNLAGYVISNPANLTVGILPTIKTQPITQTVMTGTKVTLSVVAAGTAPFTYQWFKDGGSIFGATSDTYTLNSANVSDSGVYTCHVANGVGTVTSNEAILDIHGLVI